MISVRQLVKRGIGWKFAGAILLFSSVITLLATATTLGLDYRREIDKIGLQLNQINSSFSSNLALSIWNLDRESAQAQIQGIMAYADISGVEIVSTNGGFRVSAGQLVRDSKLSRDYPLHYVAPWGSTVRVGVLRISATEAAVIQGLKDRLLVIFLTQAIKTFVVSLFILYLFYRLVGRHVAGLSHALRDIKFGSQDDEIPRVTLQRKPSRAASPDELDMMVQSINQMSQSLTAAYREIKNSEKTLRDFIDAAPNAMLMVNENKRIHMANRAACALFGYARQELLGQSVEMLLPAENLDRHVPGDSASPQRTNMVSEVSGNHKSGNKIALEVALNPIQTHEGRFVIVAIVDLTERKEHEKNLKVMNEQLAQASKMESVGHLTAGVAHDFNNMLGAIMGYTELTRQVLPKGDMAALERYQGEVLKAVNRAKELIAQMLIFSRKSAPKAGQEVPVTLLNPVVKEVVSLLRSSIPSTIELALQLPPDDLKSRILPVHLHQIILNLCVNARDAMGEYGKLEVTVRSCHVANEACSACRKAISGDYAQISIRDSGSGIAPDILDKIFDPFFTTKDVGKGTGMGLSVVHGLVHAGGGHIVVQSGAEGTVFNILLPLEHVADNLTPPPQLAQAVDIQGIRILLVDDDKAIAGMQDEFLQTKGAQVTVFYDPILALEFYIRNAGTIDIVITDETMPHLSGMHLAEALLKLNPALPIILCTGYSEYATKEAIAQIGIAELMLKPVNLQQLVETIHALSKKTR